MSIANYSDEVGVARRLSSVLLRLDLKLGIEALMELDLSDLGVRRMVVTSIESFSHEILSQNLQATAVSVIKRCVEKRDNLKKRCDDLIVVFEKNI